MAELITSRLVSLNEGKTSIVVIIPTKVTTTPINSAISIASKKARFVGACAR
ncbi:hypothetical protein HNO89_004328 [Sporosarcina luteola]|nr:hypothetical protein [Sporosarcina luteola]